jgi:hypothetical protein
MTISKDLFLAILSLDSYNRGYGAGLSDGAGSFDASGNDIDGLGEAGKKVGSASVKAVEIPAGSQDAGFYAISYTVGSGVDGIAEGTTVISYRGTDELKDTWNGWTTIGGLPGQSDLAAKFYQAVKADNPDKNIVLTGHSLGGALAGFNAGGQVHCPAQGFESGYALRHAVRHAFDCFQLLLLRTRGRGVRKIASA